MTLEWDHKGYRISTDPTRLDIDLIHAWISEESYWAAGRTRETTESAVAASLNFGAYAPDGTMVGGARVVGDGVTFAWICDVFVVDDHRDLGIGKALMNAVVAHPAVADVKRVALATGDAHSLYTRYGFEVLDNPERWMIRHGPIV